MVDHVLFRRYGHGCMVCLISPNLRHGGAGKIVVSLYVYHEPNQVIERYINTALKVERKCALIIPSRGTTHKLCLWVPFAASPLRRPLTFTLGI